MRRRLEFYLDSLVETGELRCINHMYSVTGQGVRALEEYEEQERKHAEGVRLQARALWVAVAIALLTVVQAGLIKLPAVIDFTVATTAKGDLTPRIWNRPQQQESDRQFWLWGNACSRISGI